MAKPFQDCVTLLGDSLTQSQGVPRNLFERMNTAYIRKLDVLNRGYGGYNSNGIKVLLDQILAKKEDAPSVPVVRLLTLWLGANDSTLPPNGPSLPLSTFTSNMHNILEALTSPDSPYAIADTPLSIILIATGPFLPSMFEAGSGKEKWKIKEREQGGDDGQFGNKWKIEMIDLWKGFVEAAGGEGEELAPLFSDGVHLSSAGYDILWKEISEVVHTKFAGRGLDWQDTEDLPWRVPMSKAVDWKNPDSIIEDMRLPNFRLR